VFQADSMFAAAEAWMHIDMMAPATLRTKKLLLVCLCFAALLAIAGAAGSFAAAARNPVAVAQQMSSASVAASTRRPCTFAHLSQSAGTCASLHHVGLGQWAGDQIAPPESKSSQLPLPASFAATAFHGSRLDRPPRA
jgi:hypothetical protein